MDVIDLCDSDNDEFPLHQLRSGRDENDAISLLSSEDDDSIVVVGTRPSAYNGNFVARSIAGISQAIPMANRTAPDANVLPNVGASTARYSEELHPGDPVDGNGETLQQEVPVAQANTTMQHEAAAAQAAYPSDSMVYQSTDGGVGNSETANQEVTGARASSLANNSNHLPLHMLNAVSRNSATLPLTKQEESLIQAPHRSHVFSNIQNNQNHFKREVKSEEQQEGQPKVYARRAFRSSPASTSEDENMPDVDAHLELGRMSPHRHRKKKKTARKTVARQAQFEGLDSDSENVGDYEKCLLAKRMNRLHGSNSDDDNDSSDDSSDDSSYNAIPEDAFSPPNPANPSGDPAPMPNAPHPLGENLLVDASGPKPDIEMGDSARLDKNKFLLKGLLIPKQNNNGGPDEEGMSQGVSDSTSVENRAERDTQENDDNENDAGSTSSLDGPVEPIHKPNFARRRRILEDDESADPGQVTPSSDDEYSSESDEKSLGDLESDEDKDFQGGVDKSPDLRSGETLDTIASQLHPMEKIEHLCSLGLNRETSLPTYKFSVHSKDDRIIYDFDVRVDKSSIPNAGRGVFLKFTGARELKPSKEAWGEERKRSTRRLPHPLPALYSDGSCVTVKLKGEKFPVRIGAKKIYKESDFVPAPQRTFSSLHPHCGAIELGQYGPFRPEDYMTEEKFDIHSFLFSKIPSEWGFSVSKKNLNAKKQVMNITDDLTGDTHEIACRHIPMYVNEVGHDVELKQTVSALEKDGDKVSYYVVIREPMKQGDTIELLVAYASLYEEVRERKGYAKANFQNKTKGDEHFGSFLQRNFFDREYVLEVVDELKPNDIVEMLDWFRVTHDSLKRIVTNFLDQAEKTEEQGNCRLKRVDIPLAQQIVALRRFEWIAKHLQRNLKTQKKHRLKGDCGSISTLLEAVKWSKWKDLMVALSKIQDVEDANGKKLFAALEREIVDELCYERKERIITSPMQETFWCGLAVSLTTDLCFATAKEMWQEGGDKRALMRAYATLAKDAVRKVLAGQFIESLAFVPNFKGDCTGVVEDEMRKLKPMRSLPIANGENIGEVLSILTESDTIGPLEDANKALSAIPRALATDSNVEVNSSWYICWQVLHVVDSFARKYLKGSTYSLTDLCGQLGIGTETRMIMEAALAKYVEKRSATKRKASFSSPSKPKRKRVKTSGSPGGNSGAKRKIFWKVVWDCLKENCGWRLEHGNRPNDIYAFPPGVSRGCGFKNRIHFFDSVKQIRDFIQADKKWKENALLKDALIEEEKCMALYEKLARTKSLPSFKSTDETIEWIREEVKKRK